MNFFESDCKESPRKDKLFGLCDDQNGMKAYSDASNNKKWIAKVVNEKKTEVTFMPIDNCIIVNKPATKDEESTCDGILVFKNSLFLAELKEKSGGGWISDAIQQLENTVRLLSKSHDLSGFRYKKAFACNKKHPNFTVIDHARKKSFFERTGFRIDAQATIKVS